MRWGQTLNAFKKLMVVTATLVAVDTFSYSPRLGDLLGEVNLPCLTSLSKMKLELVERNRWVILCDLIATSCQESAFLLLVKGSYALNTKRRPWLTELSMSINFLELCEQLNISCSFYTFSCSLSGLAWGRPSGIIVCSNSGSVKHPGHR